MITIASHPGFRPFRGLFAAFCVAAAALPLAADQATTDFQILTDSSLNVDPLALATEQQLHLGALPVFARLDSVNTAELHMFTLNGIIKGGISNVTAPPQTAAPSDLQIGGTLNELLKPRGVGVVIEARHLCMMARGVEKQNTVMTTSSFTGCFRSQDKTRNEFLRLIR